MKEVKRVTGDTGCCPASTSHLDWTSRSTRDVCDCTCASKGVGVLVQSAECRVLGAEGRH
jgi:hypothetical protein